ncbi:MAG: DUF2339 domain-containing protein [Cellvibrio sp.]|uniref:DUF2339 domain-containing protein n=1 Tax=Cellvibrio sp. TaxID=1965322 RepID=UPI0031A8AD77
MVLVIIFTLIGMGFGEAVFYNNGWIIGGALGFLITKIFQMTNTIKKLERDLTVLQQEVAQRLKNHAQESTTAPVKAVDPTEIQIPLAERLKAHGIELPPETAPIGPQKTPADLPISDAELESLAVESAPPALAQAQQRPAAQSKPQISIPKEPVQPSPIEKGIAYINRFFTEGNPIVRIGMVVMFFGLSFLVKYASSQGMLPIELRMAAVAAVAIALIGLGWKTRNKEGGYGLVLQGGGIAALYLTVFAAAKMYSLMPTGAAFGLMFVIVMLGAALAILQNAQVLALMATAGGFLAPILTSDGSGNHVGLFSFYLLLNIGILAIAWFKTWRLLNWVGFVFTFVITSTWGVLKYEPQLYASSQPFLLAFFALYLTVSVLFSLKQPPNLKGLVDGSLVFGLPIVGFGLQTALLKHTEYGLAISALILALIYIALARVLWAKYQHTHRVLIESFIALGVTFATLTIPLALDAQWTSATWALEATGLIWVGLRQQRMLPRLAGYLLHIGAAFSLLIKGVDAGATPIISGDFIGLLMLAMTALCISYLLTRYLDNISRFEKPLQQFTLIIGWLWWLAAAYNEIQGHISGEQHFTSLILFFALSIVAVLLLSLKTQWPQLARLGFWLLPLTSLVAMRNFGESLFIGYDVYPSQGWGLLALLAFVFVQYRFLWRQRAISSCSLLSVFHILTAWFLFSLVYWEASYWQAELEWYGTSAAVLWFACLVVPLVALLNLVNKSIWPFAQYQADYKNLIPAPLIFFLLLWFIYACRYSGITDQFYLPILNPLDLAQAAVLLIFAYVIKRGFIGSDKMPVELRYGVIGALGFVWINIVLLRAIHHYTGVAYVPHIMWDSVVVQMVLSILWAICALIVMNLSRRLQNRSLWMLGAALLGLVLVKLFTKDLMGTSTLARIASFMAVGGLMLLIGYLSPIPAKAKLAEEEGVQ